MFNRNPECVALTSPRFIVRTWYSPAHFDLKNGTPRVHATYIPAVEPLTNQHTLTKPRNSKKKGGANTTYTKPHADIKETKAGSIMHNYTHQLLTHLRQPHRQKHITQTNIVSYTQQRTTSKFIAQPWVFAEHRSDHPGR